MPKRKLTYALSAILLTMSLSVFANAQSPSLSITALTDPLLQIPQNEVRLINYKLINLSNKSYHLTMKPNAGIIQEVSNKNSCEEDMIHLEPRQSCILSLQVSANETLAANNLGPVLCDYDEHNLTTGKCFEPRVEEQIRVKELSPAQASFSAEIKLPPELTKNGFIQEHFKRCFAADPSCTTTLFVGSAASAHIVITNTSPTIINNLTASDLPTGVTTTYTVPPRVTATSCPPIQPGKTCDLLFSITPQAPHNYPGTPVTIRGSNTAPATITMQVLAVGDPYEGNQLFQLPYTSTNSSGIYYTALPVDASVERVQGFVASSLCINGSIVPPVEPLRQLYAASNCFPQRIATFIGGFTCGDARFPGEYWSSSDFQAISFFNGSTINKGNDESAYLRCVRAYLLN